MTKDYEYGHYFARNRASTIFYDALETILRPIEHEVAFYKEFAKDKHAPILEIGCGTGRITWPLVEAGYELVAADISEAMLEKARNKYPIFSECARERVSFIQADCTTLDLCRKFDLILVPYRVINYITTVQGQRQLLQVLRKHLSPEGVIILDTEQFSYEHLVSPQDSIFKSYNRIDAPHIGIYFERTNVGMEVNYLNQLVYLDVRYTVRKSCGEIISDTVDRISHRWISTHEMRLLLEVSGLRVVEEYSDYQRGTPTCIGDRVYVIAAD